MSRFAPRCRSGHPDLVGHRWVDISEGVYREVEALFPIERTAPRPSRADFLAADLLAIVEVFADHWDQLPASGAGPEFRRLITVGRLVPMVSVLGRLRPDGSVEVMDLAVDFEGLPEADED
jgi:hypothetical protein